MMSNRIFFVFLLCAITILGRTQLNVIPQPQSCVFSKSGAFVLNAETKIVYDPAFSSEASILFNLLLESFQLKNELEPFKQPSRGIIYLKRKNGEMNEVMAHAEYYQLDVSEQSVVIESYKGVGILHGIQTFLQLLPVEVPSSGVLSIAALTIKDFPVFKHRGLLLDCGRHFMSTDFIKQTLDIMSAYKMNVFHWHLTEDQGWRIEIKKYPKLTEIGGFRTENGRQYGGFYTQNEIKEIVDYATKLHITVIPEIELPGHSSAAIAAYPYLSCTGKSIPVETEWGVFKDIYCAGNDQTLQFIYDVMDEVCSLFPGKYIHIGGDEAPKVRWESCTKCQKRIKGNQLKSEAELQTWLIEQVATHLKKKGKSIIGWDEILEGGIPADAAIQSWRGMQGGIDAAQKKHGVIMSPTSHCYFDYGLEGIDTKRVYEFEPIPNELNAEYQNFIWGAECNMWTERAPQETVHSKILPRMLALSEVLWTHPKARDYNEFERRVKFDFKRLDKKGVKYGFLSTPLQFDAKIKGDQLWVELKKYSEDVVLKYKVLNKKMEWVDYKSAIEIQSKQVLAVSMRTLGTGNETVVERSYAAHQGLGKELKLNYMPSNSYSGGGYNALLDGRLGTSNFRDGIWQAVQGKDMEMLIDLGGIKDVKSISTQWFHYANAWIFRPQRVEYWGSVDGNNWKLLLGDDLQLAAESPGELIVSSACPVNDIPYVMRYVKVIAKSIGKCPNWHDAPGEPSWLFCDEIVIE
jgi:hexosaminidase